MPNFHDTILSRRELLKMSAVGALGVSASGWLDRLAAHAAEQSGQGRRHKSCILLWLDGGPSHIDTFDIRYYTGARASLRAWVRFGVGKLGWADGEFLMFGVRVRVSHSSGRNSVG